MIMTAAELRKVKKQYELLKSIRKPTLPSPRVFATKKTYNRKDQSWKGCQDE